MLCCVHRWAIHLCVPAVSFEVDPIQAARWFQVAMQKAEAAAPVSAVAAKAAKAAAPMEAVVKKEKADAPVTAVATKAEASAMKLELVHWVPYPRGRYLGKYHGIDTRVGYPVVIDSQEALTLGPYDGAPMTPEETVMGRYGDSPNTSDESSDAYSMAGPVGDDQFASDDDEDGGDDDDDGGDDADCDGETSETSLTSAESLGLLG